MRSNYSLITKISNYEDYGQYLGINASHLKKYIFS